MKDKTYDTNVKMGSHQTKDRMFDWLRVVDSGEGERRKKCAVYFGDA